MLNTLGCQNMLRTPCLVIDEDILMGQFKKLRDYAANHGFHVRPHLKAHKSKTIWDIQQSHFGNRCAVVRPEEIEALSLSAHVDTWITYPSRGLHFFNRVASLHMTPTLMVGSIKELEQVVAHAKRESREPYPVVFGIDIGLDRDGFATEDFVLELPQYRKHLQFAGVSLYGGHLYGDAAREGSEIKRISDVVRHVLEKIECCLGNEVPTVSYGSTPTIQMSHHIERVNEIRPGNYFFNDLVLFHLGHATLQECSMRIIGRVLEKRGGRVILDTGSKALSGRSFILDGVECFGAVVGKEQCLIPIVKVNEEHGFVETKSSEFNEGELVEILPVNAALAFNCFKTGYLIRTQEYRHKLEKITIEASCCIGV